MIPPNIVRDEPEHVQEMYIREFQRVEELTGDVLVAKSAADRLLVSIRSRKRIKPQSQHVLVTMTAHISEMSAMEVLPSFILKRIKNLDPHPFFAVYDIGGEGVSKGQADSNNQLITKRKLWSFRAIKELAARIKENMSAAFVGHSEKSGQSVGQVVHAFNKKIKDTLHALAIVYVTDKKAKDKIQKGELDICSVEGNVTLARSSDTSPWYVKTVENISRLALGDSKVDTPGFSSAGILATIQELEKEQ